MILVHSKPSTRKIYHKPLLLSRPDSLSNFFRKMRIFKNFTRQAFARELGVTEQYIFDIETGSKLPSLPLCLICAKIFGANPEWVKNKLVQEKGAHYADLLRIRFSLKN